MAWNSSTPSEVSYNAVASACEKGSQWEEGLRLLQGMSWSSLTPNEVSYSEVTSACEKGSR